MPILPNAKKALRSSKKKAEVNRRVKSKVRTTRKQMESNPTQENLEKAYSAIDKAVKKNVFHANKASRLKSQVSKLLKKSTDEDKETSKTKASKKKKTSKTSSTKKSK